MPAISSSGYLKIAVINDTIISFAVMEINLLNRPATSFSKSAPHIKINLRDPCTNSNASVRAAMFLHFTVLRQKIIILGQNSIDRINYKSILARIR